MRRKLFLSSMVLFVLLSLCFVVLVEADALEWVESYRRRGSQYAWSMIETSDGGYAIAGSFFNFVTGSYDFWFVKTDVEGNMEWNRTYGGTQDERVYSVVATSDGGYAIAGYTRSFGAGGYDFWFVKTDVEGNMEWNRTYGGTGVDRAYSVVEASDGGYTIAGEKSGDFWLVKTDGNGTMEWNRTYGGTEYDGGCSLVATSDGGYALAGSTESFGAGGSDFWLVKTDVSGIMEWNQTYGGTENDYARSVIETSGGGYAIAGTEKVVIHWGDSVFGYAWLVKTDEFGVMEWNHNFLPDPNRRTIATEATSLVEASDGGYALASLTLYDRWFMVIKTSEIGGIPEFSSWLLPTILMIATLVIVVYKKKLLK